MGMIGNSLAQGLISGANIQDGTVDTPDIKDGAVHTAKVADDAVHTAKIADGAVTSDKLAADITVTGSFTSQGIDDNATSTAMTLDSSGNVGIGVVPAAWHSAFDAVQVGQSSALWAQSNYDKTWLTTNVSLDVNEDFKYISSAPASFYLQLDGQHRWSYAASGTAGSTASPSEAMRIDSSGNLLVSKDSFSNDVTAAGHLFYAAGKTVHTSSVSQCLVLANTQTSGTATPIEFYYGGAVKGSVQTNTSGTTYNTTSDRRLKDNIEAITDGTKKLMAMKPVTHTWIADPEADAVHGFIAQEMQEVVPEAVTGEPEGEEMMSMDYGRITPVLVAALQDAHKKTAELEARLNALEGK